MASSSSRASLLLFCLLYSATSIHDVAALEFDVGDEEGWIVPKSKDELVYNRWASKNRFRVGDTVRFKYKKDSVMVVTGEEYESCKSLHPIFFSNSGDTIYRLDHSGTFYFVSGVTGHCERGQKMIIKVLAHSDSPAGAPPGNHTSPPGPNRSGGVVAAAVSGVPAALVMVGASFLWI